MKSTCICFSAESHSGLKGSLPAAISVDEARRMGCRVTSEGVEVKFIENEQPVWGPPTFALLRAHTLATSAQSK